MPITIKDYQEISKIPTGVTYEQDLVKYFNIDTTLTYDEIKIELENKLSAREYELKDTFIHNKIWTYEKDFLDCTFEQWIRLEQLLAEGDNIKNFEKLLAIYCRPASKKWYQRKYKIEKFDLNKQDKIAEELLSLEISIAKEILSAFFLLVIQSMNYIKIHYLNQTIRQKKQSTKNK